MKAYVFAALTVIANSAFAAPELPTLHEIQQANLSRPYSCGGSYATSALFLSAESQAMNAPDLLYNGACGSKSYIEAATAGDDFALIADLGEVPIEEASASRAFNWQRTVGQDNTFKRTQPVRLNHTYAVLISKVDVRALYVVKVIALAKDGPMVLDYAVKSYSLPTSRRTASGFDWEAGNHN